MEPWTVGRHSKAMTTSKSKLEKKENKLKNFQGKTTTDLGICLTIQLAAVVWAEFNYQIMLWECPDVNLNSRPTKLLFGITSYFD